MTLQIKSKIPIFEQLKITDLALVEKVFVKLTSRIFAKFALRINQEFSVFFSFFVHPQIK